MDLIVEIPGLGFAFRLPQHRSEVIQPLDDFGVFLFGVLAHNCQDLAIVGLSLRVTAIDPVGFRQVR